MPDFDKLDKVIHERGRLAIMTLLASRREWFFQELRTELNMSDGNLITHLRTLQEAGYVEAEKDGRGRPRTRYGLTWPGREAFRGYLNVLETIIEKGRE
jgi:DNA-binding HxlR family transcriptional regulator